MSAQLPRSSLSRISGFGLMSAADGYLYRPTTEEEIFEVFQHASRSGRQVLLRGAGRSYGDANIAAESLILDLGRMSQVHSWDPGTGLITVGPGATIETLWRTGIEDGYWPPVVSGTMFPTIGGALAMNIHGKNNFKSGTLGEHVTEARFAFPDGSSKTYTPADPEFSTLISSAGLIGALTQATIKMEKISSGNLMVLPIAIKNWQEQFETFERYEKSADYMVSWVDAFASGAKAGRGAFHVAWHAEQAGDQSFRQTYQDLPDTLFGTIPKSVVWRFLKPLNNRLGARCLNAAKQTAGQLLGDRKLHPQSLVAFSFLLDYVPGWRNTYLPGGLIQYQSFVPKASAPSVFAQQLESLRAAKLEPFLVVLKRHRPDGFNFSHGVDGYSMAMDFKVTTSNWERLERQCHVMNDIVLEANGRFYLAKDSTLRPSDFRASVGVDAINNFTKLKEQKDPQAILTSQMAKRLNLDIS